MKMTQKKEIGKSEIKSTSSGVIVYLKANNYSGKDCITKKMLNFMILHAEKVCTKEVSNKTTRALYRKGDRTARKLSNGSNENEIIRLKNRASEFKTQHEEIDNNVLQKIEIESTDDPDVFTALKQFWVEDYESEEEKSLAIWNKEEKGLRQVYYKEIRDKIDGLTTEQDEQEGLPSPISQQRA